MSLESSIGKLCYALHQGVNSSMSQRVKSCVNTRSVLGGLVLAVPLWGLDVFIYAIILWGMYISLSKIAGVPFWKNFFSNVIGGYIVNIVILFLVNLVADWIAFFGWVGMAVIGYFATKYSGAAYIEVLARIHGKNNVKETLNYNKGIESFKDNGGINAAKGIATGIVMRELTEGDYTDVSDSITPPPIPNQE